MSGKSCMSPRNFASDAYTFSTFMLALMFLGRGEVIIKLFL